MIEHTKIEWCDHSWSPWRGCTKVSAGCAHCYAETLSKRNPAVLGEWGRGKPRVRAKNWKYPVKWNRDLICGSCGARFEAGPVMLRDLKCYDCGQRSMRRRRVFPSLCDWLDDDEKVPIEWLADFLNLTHDTPNLDWLVLTKQPENFFDRVAPCLDEERKMMWLDEGTPPRNLWIGTSVEDQPNADRRAPELFKIPAAVRFLSVEPMLGPVDLSEVGNGTLKFNALNGGWAVPRNHGKKMDGHRGIDWVIVGGESGHGARPCNVEWIRSVVGQCKTAGVPCFVKQLGANVVFPHPCPPAGKEFGERREAPDWHQKFTHKKAGDPAEWPEDLRVREFPKL